MFNLEACKASLAEGLLFKIQSAKKKDDRSKTIPFQMKIITIKLNKSQEIQSKNSVLVKIVLILANPKRDARKGLLYLTKKSNFIDVSV